MGAPRWRSRSARVVRAGTPSRSSPIRVPSLFFKPPAPPTCRAPRYQTSRAASCCLPTGPGRPASRRRSPRPSCGRCGSRPEPPTAFPGRCWRPSTRSSRTSAAIWGRARPARSAGCSSCPTRGCAGGRTSTVTGSPILGTPKTPSSRRPATSPPQAEPATSPAPSSPTTTRSGTSTRCSRWPACSRATARSASRSTGCRSVSRRPSERWRL